MNKANDQMKKFKNITKKISNLCFIFGLFLLMGIPDSHGMVIKANKVAQDLPLDPEASLWDSATPLEIPLASQVVARPRHYEGSVKEIKVKALHNGKEIAFLLEWKDQTKDASYELVHAFSDGVAFQFPSERGGAKPHFAMGHEEAIVNIWSWKAVHTETHDQKVPYAVVDDFLAGLKAENPVSRKGVSIQNLQSGGFGTLTEMEQKAQPVSGAGQWASDRWKVVLKRSIQSHEKKEAKFVEGELTPLAVAVWDGSRGERGSRKTISTWHYVALEGEVSTLVYLYPFFAFLVTGGLMIGLVLFVRKRKRN
ncbi:MAG: ethylbenzene dehydrogenase-related protein [Thermodesulfobacteriota bacterium]|nr:ethylbenzene dehydrogenase-related protein [Thermodesulfobacteriota bacterium]